MSKFSNAQMHSATVINLYSMRDSINLSPEYQREGDVWSLSKKQLLVDSLLNGFDLPKFYLHDLRGSGKYEAGFRYAVIDGQQRLQAIWDFMDGKFKLDSRFELINESVTRFAGASYADLGRQAPSLRAKFDATPLTVILVSASDDDLIEDLFLRLNEAVPLSAPEKRRAIGGPFIEEVDRVQKSIFFTEVVPFKDHRSRHADVAAKLLMLETVGAITDTKRETIDRFASSCKRGDISGHAVASASSRVIGLLGEMASIFVQRDPLLRSVGLVPVWYWFFRSCVQADVRSGVQRGSIQKFMQLRDSVKQDEFNSVEFEDLSAAREFFRLAQTPNDASSIAFRVRVLVDTLVPLADKQRVASEAFSFAFDDWRTSKVIPTT